jgi:NADH dehydrogenase FAD-containing subunit
MLTIDGTTTAPPHDRLVLASGSQVVRPALPGAEHLFDVDTLTGVATLHAHLRRLPERPAEPGWLMAEGRTVMQSCQHSIPQGKFAGHNVAADVLGKDVTSFVHVAGVASGE